jgi:hypothetical protein
MGPSYGINWEIVVPLSLSHRNCVRLMIKIIFPRFEWKYKFWNPLNMS